MTKKFMSIRQNSLSALEGERKGSSAKRRGVRWKSIGSPASPRHAGRSPAVPLDPPPHPALSAPPSTKGGRSGSLLRIRSPLLPQIGGDDGGVGADHVGDAVGDLA